MSPTASQPVPPGSDPQSRVDKPWGHEVWWAQTEAYAGKLLVVDAGQRLSVQLHREKDETSYLLSGKFWSCRVRARTS